MIISEEIVNRIQCAIGNHDTDISIHEPSFSGSNAYKYLSECIDSGWVSSSGKWILKLEELISKHTRSKYVLLERSFQLP